MNDMNFDISMRDTYNKGGITLLSYSLDKCINENDFSYISLPNTNSVAVKEKIVEKYIEKIYREYNQNKPKSSLHFENLHPVYSKQNYSYLDRAIIMTYSKYDGLYSQGKSDLPGLEVAKHCVLNLLERNSDRFTRDLDNQGVSARQYAYSYIESMKKNCPVTWQSDIYRQMAYDVSLEVAERIEKNRANQLNSKNSESNSISNIVSRVKAFFPANLERAKSIIQSGLATKLAHTEGKANGMYYCQDIGKVRKNQEDALLIIEHPKARGLRMAIVSDGMGGLDKGEVASHIVVNELKKWFESKQLNNAGFVTEQLKDELKEKILRISIMIRNEYGANTGATLTGAIVGKDKALVMNVGDSRTYSVKDGKITQITQDHSQAHFDYLTRFKNLPIYPKLEEDEMRFYMFSNKISRYVGSGDREKSKPDFYEIDTKDFDQLVLCSDGVTDCMGRKDIATCVKTSKPQELAKRLVEFATTTVSVNPRKLVEFKETIEAGKDNATAVVVDKDER